MDGWVSITLPFPEYIKISTLTLSHHRVALITTIVVFQVKLEQNVGKPSRVIHIRNIPSDVSEAEIIHLGLPFGRVTNVLVLKGKNQAFLEMGDEAAATSMVTTLYPLLFSLLL